MPNQNHLDLIQVLPEAHVLLTSKGAFVGANAAFYRLLERYSEYFANRTIFDFAVNDNDDVSNYLRLCLSNTSFVLGGLTFHLETKSIPVRAEGVRLNNGSDPLVLLRLRSREEATGHFKVLNQKIEELGGEILERRKTELALRQQREWFRVTLSSIGDAVITTDENSKITFLNPVAIALSGWSSDEAIGRFLRDVFHIVNEKTREVVPNPVDRVLREGVIVGLANHTVLQAKNGREVAIEDSAAPIRDATGRISGAVMVFHDVTEKRLAEQQIRRNENLLSDFFENAPIGLHWIGPTGIVLRANRAELEMLGYSIEEYVGHNIAEFHIDRAALEAFLKKLGAGSTIYSHQARLLCKDKTVKDVFISANVLWEKGAFVHARCFTRDITQQQLAEESLRKTEQFNRTIIENSPDCIHALALDGSVIWTNDLGRKTFPHGTVAQMLRNSWAEFWQGEDRNSARHAITSAAHGATERFIGRQTAFKETKWWDVLIVPILDVSGRPEYLMAVSRDFTRRQQDEEARARLAAVIESSDDAILSMTLDAQITTWNRGAEAMFGYEEKEIIGKSVTVLIPEGRENEEPEILERLKHGERIQHYETVRRRKDGATLNVSLSVSPILDTKGKIIGVSKIARDITERKRAEEESSRYAANLEKQIAERTAHLNESIQSLEGVCYTIAHDLRSPLRAMQGFTQILLNEYAPAFDAQGRHFAERIVKGAARMDALIHDLLEYAKLSHIDLPCVNLDLNVVTTSVIQGMATEIEARRARIVVANNLGLVCANQTLLKQILTNIFENSLKFVAHGIFSEIEVTAERGDKKVRLLIKDNGIGIAPEHHEQIFEMFQRLHNDEKSYPGTGVGLAIVKKGTERMGGMVGIVPYVKSGTCFYLDLRPPQIRP